MGTLSRGFFIRRYISCLYYLYRFLPLIVFDNICVYFIFTLNCVTILEYWLYFTVILIIYLRNIVNFHLLE